MGSAETNRHLLAFGHEEKTVIVDFSHGLADGAGLMEMVKTLLYYYVHEATGQWLPADGIRTLETPITPEETTDPYLDPPPLESRFSPGRKGASDAFTLAEDGISGGGPATLWRFRVEEDAFLRYSRENDGRAGLQDDIDLRARDHAHLPGIAQELSIGGVKHFDRIDLALVSHDRELAVFSGRPVLRVRLHGRGRRLLRRDRLSGELRLSGDFRSSRSRRLFRLLGGLGGSFLLLDGGAQPRTRPPRTRARTGRRS